MVILFDGLTCNTRKLQFQKYFFFNSTVRASQSLNCCSSEELVIEHVMQADRKERLRGRGRFRCFLLWYWWAGRFYKECDRPNQVIPATGKCYSCRKRWYFTVNFHIYSTRLYRYEWYEKRNMIFGFDYEGIVVYE